ncbi:hypothetical protein DYBT9623_02709 [Dyadobacter sp. CECT 9623]|uniref:Uncharacterized protein n=1 Tax=Dyadobacter linearis TaxID=2823330 RepID=A0ABN7R958_9BACT|nr:hypothetical protein DYBT9623_02709 [Dyadobacter sp. CECT 9623]
MSRRLKPTAIDADVIDLFLKSINTRRLQPTESIPNPLRGGYFSKSASDVFLIINLNPTPGPGVLSLCK